MQAHRRHDISDHTWEILEPLLPGHKGHVGRPASVASTKLIYIKRSIVFPCMST